MFYSPVFKIPNVSTVVIVSLLALIQWSPVLAVEIKPVETGNSRRVIVTGKKELVTAAMEKHCRAQFPLLKKAIQLAVLDEGGLFRPPQYIMTCGIEIDKVSLSPLQIKSLQTRKFRKSAPELAEGLNALRMDAGHTFNARVGRAPFAFRALDLKVTSWEEVIGPNGEKSKRSVSTAERLDRVPQKFRVDWILPGTQLPIILDGEIIAAMPKPLANGRFAWSDTIQQGVAHPEAFLKIEATFGQATITDPEIYSFIFKKLADQLFVEAIEFDPLTQE
jgi:hypothetical protein